MPRTTVGGAHRVARAVSPTLLPSAVRAISLFRGLRPLMRGIEDACSLPAGNSTSGMDRSLGAPRPGHGLFTGRQQPLVKLGMHAGSYRRNARDHSNAGGLAPPNRIVVAVWLSVTALC